MTCPSCNEAVDEGAAICPHCDAVLDASAFDSEAEKPAAKKPEPPRKSSDPRRAGPAKPAAAAGPVPSASAVIQRRRRRKVQVDYSPDRILGDTWDVIQSLLPFDRVALYGAAGMTLALFFPWRFTQTDGEEIGAFGGGWPVGVLLLLAGAALFLRTSDDLRGLRPDTLALVQVLSSIASIGYCVWYFFNAIDNHPYRSLLGTTDLKVSAPLWGVVVCALAAIVLGTGSLWAWMVEKGD